MRFFIRIISNTTALYAANWLVTGFVVSGGWRNFLLAGAVLALLNMLVRPVLKALAFPLIILTLGLFLIVINAALLWTLTLAFGFVTIAGIAPLLLATLVVAFVNLLVSHTP